MLKPVSILALDPAAAALAAAVQQRMARNCGLDDLVQWRAIGAGAAVPLVDAIQSIHARRQAPESPLRNRDDIKARELVLLAVTASGPARITAIDTAREIRALYEMRRFSAAFSIELLCLLPDLFSGATAADHGATYSLLKMLSAEGESRPFDDVWLLDATNGRRVRFGTLETALDAYADAVAGALSLEPEMSGAIPGTRPRGMHPTFSSFGYGELVFPRELALQRLEHRFAAELLSRAILNRVEREAAPAALRAKQFVAGDAVAVPLSRIGMEAGQSLFRRFQAKTSVGEKTRSADELIAAVRAELKTHRSTHLENLERVAKHGEEASAELTALLARVVDEALDRADYPSTLAFLDALVDPLPDLRPDAEVAPRNLVTELNAATSALDARLGFVPNTAASGAARQRIRELESLLQDQQLVADTLHPEAAAEQLESMRTERDQLRRSVPEILFAEEAANNAARTSAREAEAARLAEETRSREQQLRDLFAQRPRAEQTLRELLEARRLWLWRTLLWAVLGVGAVYGLPFAFGVLRDNLPTLHRAVAGGLAIYALASVVRYVIQVMPPIRAARERLQRINEQIEVADRSKNAAHNDELQFEYDMAHRRTTISVVRRLFDSARKALAAVRSRMHELEELAASFVPPTTATNTLALSVIDDADVDQWYADSVDERKPLLRELPIGRAQSLHLSMEEVEAQITRHAAGAFASFGKLTLAQAAALPREAKLVERLKRFADYGAPQIELRDEDLPAADVMQRDATLWVDSGEGAFASQLRRRLPDAHLQPANDPLRAAVVSRVLHYPAYVLGQIDYYRAQYDAARHPESAELPDLLPLDFILAPPLRAAYEQVLLGRALGVIECRSDGQLLRSGSDVTLGDSHLSAAEHLITTDLAPLRRQLESDIAPRLSVATDSSRDLTQLLAAVPSPSLLDRSVMAAMIERHRAEW